MITLTYRGYKIVQVEDGFEIYTPGGQRCGLADTAWSAIVYIDELLSP